MNWERLWLLVIMGLLVVALCRMLSPCNVSSQELQTVCQGQTCADEATFDEVEESTFLATGYAIGHPYSTVTKMGKPVMNRGYMKLGELDIFTIAVDPRVIPLGSVVYIEGLGLGMATDTGTKIKGNRIDVCFTTMRDAMRFGAKSIKVVMLRSGL